MNDTFNKTFLCASPLFSVFIWGLGLYTFWIQFWYPYLLFLLVPVFPFTYLFVLHIVEVEKGSSLSYKVSHEKHAVKYAVIARQCCNTST